MQIKKRGFQYFRYTVIVLISCFLMYSIIINNQKPNINYNKNTYYKQKVDDLDRILHSTANKANYSYKKQFFYLPEGYTKTNAKGLIFEDEGNYIEVHIDNNKISDEKFYTINKNLKLIYNKVLKEETDKYPTMIKIWKNGKNQKQVLFVRNNVYIAGNIKDRDLDTKLDEMASIISSIKGD